MDEQEDGELYTQAGVLCNWMWIKNDEWFLGMDNTSTSKNVFRNNYYNKYKREN